MKQKTFLKSLFVFVLALAATAPVLGWYDYQQNLEITQPKGWVALPTAVLPGGAQFRSGWTTPEWVKQKDTYGASVVLFVAFTDGNSAKQLLDKNVSVINGVSFGKGPDLEVKTHPAYKLKVVKQQTIQVGGYQGFIMEVVGEGTGFSIGGPARMPNGMAVKIIPTRQRWYCLVRNKEQYVGIMSTCPDSMYAKYAPSFKATEATLKIK